MPVNNDKYYPYIICNSKGYIDRGDEYSKCTDFKDVYKDEFKKITETDKIVGSIPFRIQDTNYFKNNLCDVGGVVYGSEELINGKSIKS